MIQTHELCQMRILNISSYTWAIGGPARVIYDHSSVAIARGHQVTILSPISLFDEVYPVPDGVELIICKRTTPISNFFPEFSIEAYKYLKNHIHEFDIIHCHGIFHFGSIAPFLLNTKIPVAITLHGLLDVWALNNGAFKKKVFSWLIQRRLLQKAALVHIYNSKEKVDLEKYLGRNHQNVVIIPNGIRLTEMAILPPKNRFRNQFKISLDKKIVLFMGRINIKKGLDLLLPAFKKYSESYQDSVLVIAGPDDGFQSEVESFITKNSLQNQILLVGMLTGETKKAAFSDATVFTLPSYSEGFSIAVLEAMAARVSALVSNQIGFDGNIEKYNAAFEAELTVDGIYSGLSTLLQNESYRNEVAENAHKMVLELYDVEVVATELLKAFEAIVR